MRRVLTMIALAVFLLGAAECSCSRPAARSTTATSTKAPAVYITKSLRKYHRGACRYVLRSKIATTLKDAKTNSHAARGVCRPP
jgi:hypothetical protein